MDTDSDSEGEQAGRGMSERGEGNTITSVVRGSKFGSFFFESALFTVDSFFYTSKTV